MPRTKAPNPGKLCGVVKGGRPPCKNRAGMRTDHLGEGPCWVHGGNVPSAAAKAKAAIAEQAARQAMTIYGAPVETDPLSALRDELYRTAGHVAWLQLQVQAIESADKLYGPVAGGKDSYPRYEPHVWVRMYQDERKHLLAVTKTCIDVGIEAARVDAIKDAGAQIATVLRGILGDLGVLNRPEVPEIVRKHLQAAAQLDAAIGG